MFANRSALETLVKTDATASKAEKDEILGLLSGVKRDDGNAVGSGRRAKVLSAEVMSFSDAAWLLGYKSNRGVHAAVRNGVLEGYYGGSAGVRASGVLTASVVRRLHRGRSTRRR